MIRFDDLTSLDQFHQVERLEGEIWGPIDLVPVPILAVTVRRGAVLVGAFDGPRLAGFVYSFPALRPDGRHSHDGTAARRHEGDRAGVQASHWSHMLGVHPDYRGTGLGRDLKLVQRDRVLALGLDLIEWTYDPLQALNASLNFVSLGVIVEEYEENVYGESASPLHGGLPTDRFVCQWRIRRPHVERRVMQSAPADRGSAGQIRLVAHEIAAAPVVNGTRVDGSWLDCIGANLDLTDPRVTVDIPLDYTRMLAQDAERAKRWRFHTREIFTRYFAAGYRVVDFALLRDLHRGRYLLTSIPPVEEERGSAGSWVSDRESVR
jgi:predicted GNAT superfamily acetyltransferase